MRLALLTLLLFGCEQAVEGRAAESCAGCHPAHVANWQQSPHASSGTSAVFTTLLPRVEQAWGSVARARCVSCHQPNQVQGEAGIGCVSCHQALGNRGTHDGALEVDPVAPVSTAREVSAPHATATRSFLSSPELCGTCHEVRGPGLLEEPTLSEYSVARNQSNQSCATCHLGPQHRLRSVTAGDAVALLNEALTLEVTATGEVRLSNVGALHSVPTGMTALRDVWVDVTVDERVFSRVIELGSDLHGADVFTEAMQLTSRALAAGASRSWQAPPGLAVVATLRAQPVRESTLLTLGLPVPEPLVVRAVSLQR